jgi:hypothetical protein
VIAVKREDVDVGAPDADKKMRRHAWPGTAPPSGRGQLLKAQLAATQAEPGKAQA